MAERQLTRLLSTARLGHSARRICHQSTQTFGQLPQIYLVGGGIRADQYRGGHVGDIDG